MRFGLQGSERVAPWELVVQSNKPVSENDIPQIGQKLRIPSQSGVIHTVLSRQTLAEIAEVYDIEMASILAVQINGLSGPDALTVGQEILVPNPVRLPE